MTPHPPLASVVLVAPSSSPTISMRDQPCLCLSQCLLSLSHFLSDSLSLASLAVVCVCVRGGPGALVAGLRVHTPFAVTICVRAPVHMQRVQFIRQFPLRFSGVALVVPCCVSLQQQRRPARLSLSMSLLVISPLLWIHFHFLALSPSSDHFPCCPPSIHRCFLFLPLLHLKKSSCWRRACGSLPAQQATSHSLCF